MSAAEIIAGHLSELGKQLGIELSLNDEHYCCLELSDGEECLIYAPSHSSTLYLKAALLPAFSSHNDKLFAELLAWNLDGERTFGFVLALNEHKNVVMLCHQHEAGHLNEAEFFTLLERFCNAATELRERIANFDAGSQTDGGSTSEPASDGLSDSTFIKV